MWPCSNSNQDSNQTAGACDATASLMGPTLYSNIHIDVCCVPQLASHAGKAGSRKGQTTPVATGNWMPSLLRVCLRGEDAVCSATMDPESLNAARLSPSCLSDMLESLGYVCFRFA